MIYIDVDTISNRHKEKKRCTRLMPTVSQHSFGKYCWVDLSTTDPESARTFYGDLMGWEFDNLYDNGNFVYSMILLDGQQWLAWGTVAAGAN